jgi:hypothetical protein
VHAIQYNTERHTTRRYNMPVRKVKGGYRYGKTGKVYKSKAKAAKQGRAIKAAQARRKK